MRTPLPIGVRLIAKLFALGSVMAALATLMLLHPGTALDGLGSVSPTARAGFMSMGKVAIVVLAGMCAACTLAAIGMWRRTLLGWRVALMMVSIVVITSLADTISLHSWRRLIGAPIGLAIIAYLISQRKVFQRR